jgi:hypothetical protein
MPKYSTVQAYSDNSSNVQTVSYEQATAAAGAKGPGTCRALRLLLLCRSFGASRMARLTHIHPFFISLDTARPEKVVNPYGSTAGANSGDFHLYRQTRARELERMKNLTQTEEDRLKDAEFQAGIDADRNEEEARTERKRKKRQKHKEAKLRKKMLAKAGVQLCGDVATEEEEVDEDAFVMPVPVGEDDDVAAAPATTPEEDSSATNPFPNDGSFLEMMKRKLAQEQASGGGE